MNAQTTSLTNMNEIISDDMPDMEMPRYQCTKQVHALKILSIDGYQMIPCDIGFAPMILSEEYVKKHNPKVGGYYVVYADGYCSFSPAEAFENGYTLIK